jgi:hypothetical protein
MQLNPAAAQRAAALLVDRNPRSPTLKQVPQHYHCRFAAEPDTKLKSSLEQDHEGTSIRKTKW